MPTVVISALPQIPLSVGAPRIVRGCRIVSLLGDPGQEPAEEARDRRRTVEVALRTLTVAVERPTLFS